MEAKVVIWLFVFVLLYWAYCIFWGIKSCDGGEGRRPTTSSRVGALSLWVFILAATATSFSGWTFMGHPGLVYRDGFQYAYASFYTITIPFTGVMFLKRQWMLGKRFGYVTPGEMLSDYFQGDAIRILVVLVALLFSIPYLGLQLGASGFLFNVLTDDLISIERRACGSCLGGGVDLRGIGRPAGRGLRGHPAVHSAGLGHHRHRHHRAQPGRRLGCA